MIEELPVAQDQDADAVPAAGVGGVFCERCGWFVEVSLAEQFARPERYLPQACARCHGKGNSEFWRATFDVFKRLGRHDAVMRVPPAFTEGLLTDVDDVLQRAHQLAREAHAGQVDKAGRGYYEGHLLDVLQRAVAYGADLDEQAAAVLHDIVEDTDVTDQDLLACGFSDKTILIVHLKSWENQVANQLDAAHGQPLQWTFAERGAAQEFEDMLVDRGVQGEVRVRVVPAQ